MNKRYVITEGPDGIHWVSIEPLIEDMREAMDKLINIDILNIDEKQVQELNLKIAALKSVQEFFGALLTEVTLEKLRKEKANENSH